MLGKVVAYRREQMPNRNNTNAPQNISFRRFCTAVTWQYSVLSALRPHKITRKSFALRCLAVPQCRFLAGARSLPQAILCIVKTNDTATAEIGFAGPCSYCSCSAYRTWPRKRLPWHRRRVLMRGALVCGKSVRKIYGRQKLPSVYFWINFFRSV